jgi:hypothetical protein
MIYSFNLQQVWMYELVSTTQNVLFITTLITAALVLETLSLGVENSGCKENYCICHATGQQEKRTTL